MSLYVNKNPYSPYAAVEFSPRPEGNFTVFYLKKSADKDSIASLIAPDFEQEILSQTYANGQLLLVTRGRLSQEQVLQKLETKHGVFQKPVQKAHFQPWKWRGNMSFLGQGLTLASSIRKGALDGPKLMFATLNILANCVNLAFGGQKLEDEHQLRLLKTLFNERLQRFLPEGQTFPSPEENRADLRHEERGPPTLGEKFNSFMRKNSVRVGEIGLRYLGAISLAFPMKNWKKAGTALIKGAPREAFEIARNPISTNFYTGAAYLVGKTIGLFSKVPDPYNTKPHTMLDSIREKILFRLSTTIETGAATTLAYGGFKKDSKGNRDMLGGFGGVVLAGGLTTRFFAKFGTRVLDREELRAYLTDCLARIPPDHLPQAVADIAASLHEHYGDQSPGFAEIYNNMRAELYRYHAIAISPETAVQPVNAIAPDHIAAVSTADTRTFTDTIHSHANHSERALATIPSLRGVRI